MTAKTVAKPIILPALAFGNTSTHVEGDLNSYRDRMATVLTSLREYEAVGRKGDFRHKSAILCVNGMRMVAGAVTPISVSVDDSSDLTLMIPFHGENISTVGRTSHVWAAHQAAMFFPKMGRGGVASLRSTLNFDLTPERLQWSARSMLGLTPDQNVDLELDRERAVSLHYGRVSFDSLLRAACRMIDQLHLNPTALSVSGIDETLYRIIVTMMRPDLFLDDQDGLDVPPPYRALDMVCEYVLAHLEEPITLTILENVAGLSRRSLQYAFLKRFGCSPMEWVRLQRLHVARSRLASPPPRTTVTDIALGCGFTHMARFSKRYLETFGELPSATLAQALRKRS